MDQGRKKVFLIVQCVLCILITLLLVITVINIYREGLAAKAEDPLAWIFSREIVAERLTPILPLIFALIGTTAAGLIMDVKDEKALKGVKPVRINNVSKDGKAVFAIVLIVAVCFIVAGVFNGSAKDVLGKAINICTECVGLG